MQIQNFNFNGNDVRVLADEHGEPWFVAKDVAEVLGYNHTPHLTRNLDPEDISVHIKDRIQRGNPNVKIINESGLYTAVLHSRRPEAKEFKRWVTSEVLPSIRKHGAYVTTEKMEEWLNDPDTMIRTLEKLKEERERRQKAEKKIAEDAPKVEQYEKFMDTEGLITVTDLAKALNLGPKKLTQHMRKKDIIEKRKDRIMPKEPYNSNGYFEIKYHVLPNGNPKPHARLTAEGFEYFSRKFDGLQL